MIDANILNWRELASKYSIEAHDSQSFLEKFLDAEKDEFIKRLDELEGSYAIAMKRDGVTIIARDIFGIRPIFYDLDDGLSYSFNKGVGKELNPRQILVFTKGPEFIDRKYFSVTPEIDLAKPEIITRLQDLLFGAIKKRVPEDGSPVGVLFSGGVDSTFLAYTLKILKEQGKIENDLVCFTAGFVAYGQDEAKDLVAAKKVAEKYGFENHTNSVDLESAESMIKKVISIIGDTNVVKVGVGVTGWAAGINASKRVKVIFSGLGSEEIFAGYNRHKKAENVNEECLKGLMEIHTRDCYRDYMICKEAGLELRLPFLDRKVVDFSLKIPAKFKLADQNKLILRDVAVSIGISAKFAQRKKLGAQYGSKFDKAIAMLAKRNGFKYKSDYLDSLNETGKDI